MIFFPSSSFRYYFFCLCLLAGISSCTKNFVLSGLDDKLPENPQPVLSPYDSFHIDNVRWLHSVMKEREFKDLTFNTFRLVWTEGGDKKLEVINIKSDPNLALYVLDVKEKKDAFYMQRIGVTPTEKGDREFFKPAPFEVNHRFKSRKQSRRRASYNHPRRRHHQKQRRQWRSRRRKRLGKKALRLITQK